MIINIYVYLINLLFDFVLVEPIPFNRQAVINLLEKFSKPATKNPLARKN